MSKLNGKIALITGVTIGLGFATANAFCAKEQKSLSPAVDRLSSAWRAPFASCIAEAQTTGEIDSTFDPMDLAEFLLASWEGAILRMKVERGLAALDRFKNIVFQTIFKGEQK